MALAFYGFGDALRKATEQPTMLEVRNLAVKTRGVHAVRNISLSIASGETLGLIGASGCGKSVSGSALPWLLPADAQISAKTLAFAGQLMLGCRRYHFSGGWLSGASWRMRIAPLKLSGSTILPRWVITTTPCLAS